MVYSFPVWNLTFLKSGSQWIWLISKHLIFLSVVPEHIKNVTNISNHILPVCMCILINSNAYNFVKYFGSGYYRSIGRLSSKNNSHLICFAYKILIFHFSDSYYPIFSGHLLPWWLASCIRGFCLQMEFISYCL